MQRETNDPAGFVFQPVASDINVMAQGDEEIGQVRTRILHQAVPIADGAVLGLGDPDATPPDAALVIAGFWTSPRYAGHVRRLMRFQMEHQGKGRELDFDYNWLADYPTQGSQDLSGVVRLEIRMKSGDEVIDRAFAFATPDVLGVLEAVLHEERLWLYPERPQYMDQVSAGLVLAFGDVDRLHAVSQVIETYRCLEMDGPSDS